MAQTTQAQMSDPCVNAFTDPSQAPLLFPSSQLTMVAAIRYILADSATLNPVSMTAPPSATITTTIMAATGTLLAMTMVAVDYHPQ